MPEVLGILFMFGLLAGIGYFCWIFHKKEEQRKKVKEQMKYELKRGFRKKEKLRLEHERKKEKAQMNHELKMNSRGKEKDRLNYGIKKDKAQKNYDLKMNGHETTGEKNMKTIRDYLKIIGDTLIGILNKK